MNYIGRKDGGKYIPANNSLEELTEEQKALLIEVAYSPEVAEFARDKRISYREAFKAALLASKTENDG